MTRDDALALVEEYADVALSMVTHAGQYVTLSKRRAWTGLIGMRERFPANGSERKAMRWLGFCQGVMVASGVFSLDEVKEHSRRRRVDTSEVSDGR
jgi:hypothetical protein